MRPLGTKALVAAVLLSALLVAYSVAIVMTVRRSEPAGASAAPAATALPTPSPASTPVRPSTSPVASPSATAATPSATTGPPTATPSGDDPLVDAARAVKPLDALEPGDRVLYEGDVWFWRGWDERPALSWITETPEGEDRIQVHTALLTPVEAAEGE